MREFRRNNDSAKVVIGLILIILSVTLIFMQNVSLGIVLAVFSLLMGISSLRDRAGFAIILILGPIIIVAYSIFVFTPSIEKETEIKNTVAKRLVETYANDLKIAYYAQIMNGSSESQETFNNLVLEGRNPEITCNKKILTETGKIELEECTVEGFSGTYNYKDGIAE